jgi:hypothetical protein
VPKALIGSRVFEPFRPSSPTCRSTPPEAE